MPAISEIRSSLPVLPSVHLESVSQDLYSFFQQKVMPLYARISSLEFWDGYFIVPVGSSVKWLGQRVEGAFWGGLVLGNGINLLSSIPSSSRLEEAQGSIHHEIHYIWLRFVKNGVSFSGSCIHLALWAHSVKWIDLKQAVGCLKGAGYISSMIVSIMECYSKSVTLYHVNFQAAQETTSSESRKKLIEHRRLCYLEIAVSVNTIVWAILGITALFFSTPALAFASMLVSGITLPLVFATFCYKLNVEFSHPKETSPCCALVYA